MAANNSWGEWKWYVDVQCGRRNPTASLIWALATPLQRHQFHDQFACYMGVPTAAQYLAERLANGQALTPEQQALWDWLPEHEREEALNAPTLEVTYI